MAGWLTTHVLDTSRGVPAAELEIGLFRVDGDARAHVATARTNADGRTDDPILGQREFSFGTYELEFHVRAYLEANGEVGPGFLDIVPVRFTMTEDTHYHVPLLLSPYGYSTYRGS